MAEYAGYVGNQVPPTDWGKVGTQLFDQYNEVKKDREEKRQVIEDDFATTFQKIGEYESTTNQTINEYLYKGVDEARNALKTQYDLLKKGAITMADYKLKKNTLTTDWGNVSKALKNNAGIMESIQKMNASGEMSAVGRYRSEEYGNLLDIRDGKLFVNPDTLRIYGTKANPKTGLVDSESNVYSPTEAVNQYNIVDKKVDLNDGVTSFLKRVSDYGISTNLGGGKIKLVENARQNPSYQKALDAQVNAMTVTPFNVASVLADYAGDYQVATESKKKELIASGVKEDKIILMQRVNGVLTPVPTTAQKEVAKAYVRDQIEVGVGQKEQMTQGFSPQQPREAKQPSDRAEKDQESVLQAQEAFESLRTMGENSPYATLLLSSAVARDKESGPLRIGLMNREVYEKGTKRKLSSGSTGFVLRDQSGNIVKTIQNPKDLFIFTNPGTAELESEATYNNVAKKLGAQPEQRGSYRMPAGTPQTSATRVSSTGWK